MKIQLKHWQILDMTMSCEKKSSFINYKDSSTLELKVSNDFIKDEAFEVIFDVSIADEEFNLQIQASFNFELDIVMTENFKNSHFPKVNAPAIAFPYLRAFISNLTLQSGIKPVILPSINFVEFAKQ